MTSGSSVGESWLVACLCAGWCSACREYRATFEQLARAHPDMRFVWVDIEDESDALSPFDLDIQNFPTVLVARGAELRFLGVLQPQSAALSRTLQAAQRSALAGQQVADPSALVACVRSVGTTIG